VAKKVRTQTIGRDEPAPEQKPFVSLDQVLGQDRALGQLRAAVSAGRIHHAWIFHGPVGVGKFTTAQAFAAMLLDPTTAPDLSGVLSTDPESATQKLIRAGTHPDLHVIVKELAAVSSDAPTRDRKQFNIPLEVLREFLLEPASKTRVVVTGSPVGKVFIVDEAELIDIRGQNSLLKMLEEPPVGSVIILVTSSEERLLPTIRSRCQRVAFAPLSDAAMKEWLKRSGASVTPEQTAWVLKFAAGAPGVAAIALENELFTWHRALGPMLERLESGMFPIEMGATMAQFIDERAAAWVKKNPDASKDAANKAWARRMFAFLAEHYRQRLGLEGGAGGGIRAADAIQAIARAEEQLGANVNLALVMENLTAQLSLQTGSAA
jgi:DNA polymerase III subunit delta'